MKPLFVYGTLQPGRENVHLMEKIGGEWLPATVQGTYYARGWGAAADYPGLVLDPQGADVPGFLFFSDNLTQHWPQLDEFESGYDRVSVIAHCADGRQVEAWVYQLQPRNTDSD